ncbi:MAG: hypothetical protein ACK551_01015 [Vampirovibrionales bacterium]
MDLNALPQFPSLAKIVPPAAPVANTAASIAPAPPAPMPSNLTPGGSPQALAKTPQGLFGEVPPLQFAGPVTNSAKLGELAPEKLKDLAVADKLALKGNA